MTPWAPELILPAERGRSAELCDPSCSPRNGSSSFLSHPDHAPPNTCLRRNGIGSLEKSTEAAFTAVPTDSTSTLPGIPGGPVAPGPGFRIRILAHLEDAEFSGRTPEASTGMPELLCETHPSEAKRATVPAAGKTAEEQTHRDLLEAGSRVRTARGRK